MCIYEFPRRFAGRPKAVKTACLSPSTEIAISFQRAWGLLSTSPHAPMKTIGTPFFMNGGSGCNKPVNQEKDIRRK